MALDGLTIAALRKELADFLTEGRIQKIVQTEKDELFFYDQNSGGFGTRQTGKALSFRTGIFTACLSLRGDEGGTSRRSFFLYAASQAFAKRPHRIGLTAGTGACPSL